MKNSSGIPSVDLQDFLSDDSSRKEKFVSEIGSAFEEIGFVTLKNHFLSDQLVTNLYSTVKQFFDLPKDEKEKYSHPTSGGQRGYTSFGKEHAKGSNKGDLKEFWHFGQNLSKDELEKYGYLENIQVPDIHHFNTTGDQAFAQLEKTGIYVLRAIAIHLGIDEHFFDQSVEKGNSILRPIHYPAITEEPQGAVRAGAHGDINLITLLMGASTGGLQVKDRQDQWVDAIPSGNDLVINVGDMLERLTNGVLRSTIHRVVNPPKEEWDKPRYSIPFFMHPVSEMSLSPLEVCVTADNPKHYEDITAGEFLNQRLREIGLIK